MSFLSTIRKLPGFSASAGRTVAIYVQSIASVGRQDMQSDHSCGHGRLLRLDDFTSIGGIDRGNFHQIHQLGSTILRISMILMHIQFDGSRSDGHYATVR